MWFCVFFKPDFKSQFVLLFSSNWIFYIRIRFRSFPVFGNRVPVNNFYLRLIICANSTVITRIELFRSNRIKCPISHSASCLLSTSSQDFVHHTSCVVVYVVRNAPFLIPFLDWLYFVCGLPVFIYVFFFKELISGDENSFILLRAHQEAGITSSPFTIRYNRSCSIFPVHGRFVWCSFDGDRPLVIVWCSVIANPNVETHV